MRKIVKGKIQKYYCDVCGRNICDYIPKKSDIKLMGMSVVECTIKKHCDYIQIRKVTKQADYCSECYEKIEMAQ